jgi:hypothetical protein
LHCIQGAECACYFKCFLPIIFPCYVMIAILISSKVSGVKRLVSEERYFTRNMVPVVAIATIGNEWQVLKLDRVF